jgi:putative oxidoreductase
MNRFFSSSPMLQTTGLTLIRIAVGCFMIYHGSEIFNVEKINEYLQWDIFKNSSGKLLVYLGKGAELTGGILLVVGLFTRIASILLIGTMLYITFFLGHGKIWYEDQYPFLFALLGLVFVFMGGGRLSLDNLLFKKHNNYA